MLRLPGLALVTLLASITLWAPLPFGSITRGGQSIVQAGAFLALALAAWQTRPREAVRAAAAPVAAVAGIGLIGLLQSLTLPAALVKSLSPRHELLQARATALLGEVSPPTLSLAPAASRTAALTWCAIAAALLGATLAARPLLHRRVLLATILAAGTVQVIYGARTLFARSTTIWGVEVGDAGQRLRGSFVNADHVAVHLEIALAVAFAWCWAAVRRGGTLPTRGTLDRWLLQVAPPLLLWLVLFTGLAFTGSRAGLIAAIFGVVAQGMFLALERRRLATTTLGALMATLGLAFVAAVSVEQGLGRFMTSTSLDAPWDRGRARVYQLSLELWSDFRLTGTGLATFRDAFPLVQTADLEGAWWHAHSGPIELLVTTGVLGTVLVGAGLGAMLVRLATDLRRRLHPEEKAASLAALGAVAAVGLHESVDFGLTMPANALALAVLCGAALAPVAPATVPPSPRAI